jgi:hypothetical protein
MWVGIQILSSSEAINQPRTQEKKKSKLNTSSLSPVLSFISSTIPISSIYSPFLGSLQQTHEHRELAFLANIHREITRQGAPVCTGIEGAGWIGPEPEVTVRDEVVAVDVRHGGMVDHDVGNKNHWK